MLHPHVAECVVMAVGQERTAKGRNKTDVDDAFVLAEKLRSRTFGTAVYKQVGISSR
jgi:hypothetical protein